MDLETSLVSFVNDGILAGKSPETIKSQQGAIKVLLDYTKQRFIPQRLEELNEQTVADFFVYGLKYRKWSKVTHHTYYKNLLVYFNWLVRKNIVPKPLMEGIPKPRLPQQPPKSFCEQEASKILQVVANMPCKYAFYKARNVAVITTFIFTGLRKNELINLRTDDVDLINSVIYIHNGKGGKKREVPINQATLLPILKEYEAHRQRLAKSPEWFFTGTFDSRGESNGKLSLTALYWLFRKLNQICHLSKRISAHKLRHTFATIFLDKTDDIYTLQQLLGHSSIKTTTIYLSTTRKKKVEAINKMNITTPLL